MAVWGEPLGAPVNQSDNNTLSIFLPFLRPQTWVVYKYVVVPHKTGFLDADTLVNFGNSSYYKSRYVPWGIKINPEEFEVTLNPEKDEEDSGTDINIFYNIRYLGIIPNGHNFSVSLDDSSKEFNCTNNKTQTLTFNSSEYQLYSPTVKYNKIGEHYLPNILIDNIPYPAKGPQTITIDDFFIRNKDSLDIILQILSIIVAIFVALGYIEFRNIERSLRDIKK
jgi:hypothetical protein